MTSRTSFTGTFVMRRFLLICGAAALLSCTDSTSPGVPNADLHIVQQDSTAPPLASMQGSFWAKVGEGREIRIGYQPAEPGDSEDAFFRFEVPGDALLRKPDGTAFQAGDSILITVTVVDTANFLFRFEPSGLQFNPDHPAHLKIEYDHADHDFNDDGVVNAANTTIEQSLDLWRRESATAPWFRMGAVRFEELEEIDANILSFTEYAIAW